MSAATAPAQPGRISGMTTVTLKGLWSNRSRFTLTGLAVLLSVAFLSSMLLLTDSLAGTASDDIATANQSVGAIIEGEELAAADGPPGASTLQVPVDEATLATVSSVDGVVDAVGIHSGSARVLDDRGRPVDTGSIDHVGETWVDDPALNPFTLIEGAAPATSSEVAVEKVTADEAGLAVGDTVSVLTQGGSDDSTISGIVTYGQADGSPIAGTVLYTPEAAASLFGASGYERVVVGLDGVDNPATIAAIDLRLGSDDLVVTSGTEWVAAEQAAIEQRTGFQSTFLLFFAVVAMIAGTTIIYNTFVIAVAQRTRELALLRSIGASRRQVLSSVMAESAVIGVVASVLGAVAGVGVFQALVALFDAIGLSFIAGSPVISWSSVALSAVIGVLVTLASAFMPARKAAAIPPVAALRDAVNDQSASSRVRNMLAVAMLGSGVVLTAASVAGIGSWVMAAAGVGTLFIGVLVGGPLLARTLSNLLGHLTARLAGIVGQMATSNAARNPRRSASTAFSLTLGVALISFFTVIAGSMGGTVADDVGNALSADLVATSATAGPGAEATVPTDLVGDLQAVEGVAVATPLVTSTAVLDGAAAAVAGVDVDAFPVVYDLGFADGTLAALDASTVAVGADTGLSVGDELTFTFPQTGELTVTVGAIYASTLPGVPQPPEYVFDAGVLQDLAPTAQPASVYLSLDSADDEATTAAVQAVVDDAGGAILYTEGEYTGSLGSFVDTFRNFVYSLLGVAVVIAVVGIANTTVMAVNERTSEIGMLRAVGMTSRQVRAMIRNEAVMLSIQGAVIGLGLGVAGASAAFAALAGDEGISLVIPYTSLAVIAVGAALSGVVAAAWPAWRASRLRPLEAMAA